MPTRSSQSSACDRAKAEASGSNYPGAKRSFVSARALPFIAYIAALATESFVPAETFPFDLRLLYALRVLSATLLLVWFWREYEELRAPPRISWTGWLAAVLVGVVVFVVWIHLDASWMVLGASKGFDPTASNADLDWALVALRIGGATLVVPIIEELFWRSFLMRWIERQDFLLIRPGNVGARGLILSSLVFGLEHHQWVAGVIAGLAYAELYRRTANLWAPIAAHALTNLILGIWVVRTASWQYW